METRKKKSGMSLFALLLSLLLMLSACGAPAASTPTPDPSGTSGITATAPPTADSSIHQNVKFSELEYVRPDMDALDQKIQAGLKLCTEEGKETELLALYDEILKGIANVDTMHTLASIRYNLDTSDRTYETEMNDLSNYYTRMDNQMNELTGAILDSAYAEAANKAWGEDFIQRYEINSKLNSKEIEALSEQENELVIQYSNLLSSDYTTQLNGKTVTLADLDLSREESVQAYYEIFEKKNKELGEIYLKLRDIRIEIAGKLGYDSYIDYAYDLLGRDYTPEEAYSFCEKVKKELAPVYLDMYNQSYETLARAQMSNTSDPQDALPILKQALASEFPEKMQEALTYMENNGLYDFSGAPNKLPAGYTTLLADYAAPYMFINSTSYSGPGTVIHEFGHYYNFYLMPLTRWNDSNNLDGAEIHSQGLELLMQPYYDEFYGESSEDQKVYSIVNMLSSIMQGCAEDEFQQYVFNNPKATLEELNSKHGEIFSDYMGYPLYYEWVEIHHHFETPFYYVSYATSAVSALEIWKIATGDRAEALSVYDHITQYTTNYEYRQTLSNCGLKDPFTSDVITQLAKTISDQFLK